MTTKFDPQIISAPLSAAFRNAIDKEIATFLEGQRSLIEEVGTSALLDVARSYVTGGKGLRPAFCLWSYLAVGGDHAELPEILTVAASLDLLHNSALVHDDLIDSADTRRGMPAAHRQFEQIHVARRGRGNSLDFGSAAAVLLGDMLLMWSAEMFESSSASLLAKARPELHRMRAEVTAGQFLDISAAFAVADDEDELRVAEKVLAFKSASYSMRRPLLIGAQLGAADEKTYRTLGLFGSHIGHAFQLRDDVLGVFGDAKVTGKPTGRDLVEGKATILVILALRRCSEYEKTRLRNTLGNKAASAEDIAEASQIISSCGARQKVEALIHHHYEQGLAALHECDLDPSGKVALEQLAKRSVQRVY